MQKFILEGYDYIELNKLMKKLNLVSSGGEAKIHIQDGLVSLNGETELRVRKKLVHGDKLSFQDNNIEIIKG